MKIKIAIIGCGFVVLAIFVSLILMSSSSLPENEKSSLDSAPTSTLAISSTQIITKTTPSRIPKKESTEAVLSMASTTTEEQSNTVLVVKVVDGDTIEIEGGQRVRYIGVNTPESVDPRRGVQCFGKEASDKNKELVLGKRVRLVKDVSETDKYGRLLRFVYVDDQFVNDYLVRQGYARVSTYPPDVHFADQFKEAEREAREQERGLWNSLTCNGSNTIPSVSGVSTTSQTSQLGSPAPIGQPVTNTGAHTWYTSSYYTSKKYYCDTDPEWKLLSTKYLRSFSTEAELLKVYPNKTLNTTCQ
jgi:micrococcal nuclease